MHFKAPFSKNIHKDNFLIIDESKKKKKSINYFLILDLYLFQLHLIKNEFTVFIVFKILVKYM